MNRSSILIAARFKGFLCALLCSCFFPARQLAGASPVPGLFIHCRDTRKVVPVGGAATGWMYVVAASIKGQTIEIWIRLTTGGFYAT
jgi:hypothetical protein